MNLCKIPVPVEDNVGDNRWISIHNRFLSEGREKDADVIFIGDSIIQALQHTDVWNELFVPLHCLNFGVHRDRIENVLWRVQNGELDNVKPKVIVLHVGTNNYNNTVEEIHDGIVELIQAIRERHPNVYIVLPTLLPRGQNPNSLRDKFGQVNEMLKTSLAKFPKLELVSIDKGFIQPDGTISHHDMHDYLLLTNAGSKKAFEPVHELILQLLHEGDSEKELLSE
ncbi:platelet-activating factor acetylhydrolase IB subunit beta homolog [Anthonomus grandis grandis]|uniref:platelet-activating factor acetylhydrolase IB subunit beta homolog n=1 Tax=Anthonomus grandis grandis TaxID=2921223 RepID=UPI00216526A0|nr:platelet-activating factor acetylhydrolase IB subunit beta homolog [Anthonomus grandis grandis]